MAEGPPAGLSALGAWQGLDQVDLALLRETLQLVATAVDSGVGVFRHLRTRATSATFTTPPKDMTFITWTLGMSLSLGEITR